ncbi:MAG: NAD-dependent deacylase [Sphingobacteriaceae bacterium]|jgi:NAD-dependent deacetylase|nr:NAD-dependent deacylase [Sphingobacteriaceae bacterium]
MVQDFYNMRRKAVLEAKPNEAHLSLVKLEAEYDVTVITQNVDDLHERAGSSNILHLHRIITKSQSSLNPKLTYDISGWELKIGERCERGSQLRPHVVWFGEPVPMIEKAAEVCATADIFIIIGTSLQVYPAAGLVEFAPEGSEKIVIDPKAHELDTAGVRVIAERATAGVPMLVEELLSR